MSDLSRKLTADQLAGGLIAVYLSPELESLSHGNPRFTAAAHRQAEGIDI